MKYFIKSKAVIILCLVAVFPVIAMSGCSDTKITTTQKLPQSLDELSLTEMWNAVAEAADIQEPGAQFDNFRLRTDVNGSIDLLSFNFLGKNEEGTPCIYIADMVQEGNIEIREYEGEPVSISAHPMVVFTEIDKLGLASLEPGETGLTMEIYFLGGDVGYQHAYRDIYHLKDGQLLPLKQLIFHTDVYWCNITIFQNVKHVGNEAEMTATVTVNPDTTANDIVVPLEERTSQIWFLSEDINKAETVEYLRN